MCVILVNMNANQAFCVAIAVLLLQIINIQQQQMFAFFIQYQRWANGYFEMLTIVLLRRRYFCRVRNRPYAWSIPHPGGSISIITSRQFNRSTFGWAAING